MRWIVNPSDNRWRVRIDGRDVAEVILTASQAGPFRDHVAEISGARVSLGLAMNMEGTLVTIVPEDNGEPGHDCGEPGRPVDMARCGDCWDAADEQHALRNYR